MNYDVYKREMAEIAEFGLSGVLTHDGLVAMACIIEKFRDRLRIIHTMKQDIIQETPTKRHHAPSKRYDMEEYSFSGCGDDYFDIYGANRDGSTDVSYISFADFLDPNFERKLTNQLAELKSSNAMDIQQHLEDAAIDEIASEKAELNRLLAKYGS